MGTQTIERRVEKMEQALRIGVKPQTLDEMFECFERGDYGRDNFASIVTMAFSTSDREGVFKSLRETMPDLLVDWFAAQLKKGKAEEKVNEN